MSDRDLRSEVRKWRKAALEHLTQKNEILDELNVTQRLNRELSIDYWKMKDQRDSTILAIGIYIVVFVLSVIIALHLHVPGFKIY
jgi:hypothetical protein